jgi:hypothetical protein
MTDPLENELRELERITSADPWPPGEPGHQSTLLREGWSRWTQLLEAADAEWDEAAFVERIQPPPRSSSGTRWLVCGALAASLLIGLAAAWSLLASRSNHATSGHRPIAGVVPSSRLPSLPAATAQSSGEFAWDDTLDERLADVDGALARLRNAALSNDSRLTILGSRLEQFQQEINTGTL